MPASSTGWESGTNVRCHLCRLIAAHPTPAPLFLSPRTAVVRARAPAAACEGRGGRAQAREVTAPSSCLPAASPTGEAHSGSCFPGPHQHIQEGGLTFSCLRLGLHSSRNGHWEWSRGVSASGSEEPEWSRANCSQMCLLLLVTLLRDGTASLCFTLSALP